MNSLLLIGSFDWFNFLCRYYLYVSVTLLICNFSKGRRHIVIDSGLPSNYTLHTMHYLPNAYQNQVKHIRLFLKCALRVDVY